MASPPRPRATLSRILEDLDSMIEPLGGGERLVEIERLSIHDPDEATIADAHTLVLGVGLRDPGEVTTLLARLGPGGCAGLVLRAPVELDDTVEAAAAKAGIPLLALAQGMPWMQLAAMLRRVLAHDEMVTADEEMLGGIAAGDVFAVANAIASLLDAPVTIEDRHFRVIAFSGRQEEADPSRIAAVLNREVSVGRTRDLEERGIVRQVYQSDDPVFIEPPASGSEDFTMPRQALAIRAGDEVLGSIWAAVHEPMTADRARAFKEIGPLVALHLLRERAGADVERRLRTDLVATALEGGARAVEAARKLGLSHQSTVVVSALVLEEEPEPATTSYAHRLARRRRIADAFAMHLSVTAPGSTTALVSDVVYGIIVVRGSQDESDRRVTRLVQEFLTRTQTAALIGIGSAVDEPAALAHSREGADRALRVLRSGSAGKQVAGIDDVAFDALLIEFSDLMIARGHTLQGPLAKLIDYDAKHKSNLVETLRAWLEAFGNVVEACDATFVHPNTFRYRLRRLTEVAEIDLADPDTRLALMLQLRLLAME